MASLAKASLVEMPATKEVGPNQWNLMTTYNGSSSKSMDSYNKMSYEDQQAWDQAALESALESSVSMASNEIGRKLKKTPEFKQTTVVTSSKGDRADSCQIKKPAN